MIEMQKGNCRNAGWLFVAAVSIGFGIATCASSAFAQASSPAALRVDEMVTPLGIDNTQPRFSWQLRDSRQGARQTAYQLLVASKPELLQAAKADIWDSGRIASGQSVAVRYGGPTIAPSTRYYWKVLVWDQDGTLAPESPVSWWESGLLGQGWKAKWIGYETDQEHAVRYSGAKWITSAETAGKRSQGTEERIAYRVHVELARPVRHATLFLAAENTASAWINGNSVMERAPLPAWKQLPWKKCSVQDVTSALAKGSNTLAVESTHYLSNSNGDPINSNSPTQATLVVEYADGSMQSWISGAEWKASLHPAQGW